MTALKLHETPFLLRFARQFDLEVYERAVSASDELGATYDPMTQTSDYGIYAGTYKTIERTTTDWSIRKDDSRITDD